MRGSGARFDRDQACIRSLPFLSICRGINLAHFSRKRKLFLEPLVLSILNRKGVTLSMEIRRLFRLLNPRTTDVISKAGYLKQRMKLNPAAFTYLNDFHVRNFYEDEKDLLTYKGHFVLAIDGSHINLPNTQENLGVYGFQVNQFTQQAQAGVSCLYDVFNKMVLDCTINHYKFSERDQAEAHIEKIPALLKDQPYVVMLDRGYPSSFFFMDRLERNEKFV